MHKRIFVGLDYFAANFYLVGLTDSFQFIFFKKFSIYERTSMEAFLGLHSSVLLVYRIPYFACRFEQVCFRQAHTMPFLYSKTKKPSCRHDLFFLGYEHQYYHYQVAYIDEFYYQEQLDLLGKCAKWLYLVEIDYSALWLMRWYENPQWGLSKVIEYRQGKILHQLYGKEACFYSTNPRAYEVMDKLEESPWLIAKALAIRGYYHAI